MRLCSCDGLPNIRFRRAENSPLWAMGRLVYGVVRTFINPPPETCVPRGARGILMTSRPRHPMPIMRRLLLPQPFAHWRLISLINRVSVASRSAAPSLIAESWPMSVCCGSLRAAPSPLVTAHLLADSSCHTYYPNLAEHRWEKKERTASPVTLLGLSCQSITILTQDWSCHTLPYALCSAPKSRARCVPVNRYSSAAAFDRNSTRVGDSRA